MTDLTVTQSPVTMTSREIAELTGKSHAHVLRDIDNIVKSLNPDLVLGFKTSTYKDTTGKENRQYELDRDSSYCVVAGYDPNSRMRIIKRWQELEAANVPKSIGDVLVAQALAFRDNERRLAAIEQQQFETKAQIAALIDGANHFTVLGYANVIGLKLTNQMASQVGKIATGICREMGWPMGKAHDPRYGVVGSYPREAIAKAFEAAGYAA